MAFDDSTTVVMTAAAGFLASWACRTQDGTVNPRFDTGATLLSFATYDTTGTDSSGRVGFQFVWPNALIKSPEGSMLDPPVFASASLTVNVTTLNGSIAEPAVTWYVALEPEIDFINDSYWPGPVFPAPGPAPDSALSIFEFINIMPRINGDRKPVLLKAQTLQSFDLDAAQLGRIVNDQPGKTAWDLNFTIIGVADDELLDFPALKPSRLHGASIVTGVDFTLTVEYIRFNTGFMTNAEGATRAVMDSRFGIPSLSAELVEDKYLPGIWVRSEHQDPDDGVVRYPKRPERRTDRKPVS